MTFLLLVSFVLLILAVGMAIVDRRLGPDDDLDGWMP